MIESDEGEVRWSILGIGNRTCKNAVADKGVFHLFLINLKDFLGIMAEVLTSPEGRALLSIGVSNPGKYRAPMQRGLNLRTKRVISRMGIHLLSSSVILLFYFSSQPLLTFRKISPLGAAAHTVLREMLNKVFGELLQIAMRNDNIITLGLGKNATLWDDEF